MLNMAEKKKQKIFTTILLTLLALGLFAEVLHFVPILRAQTNDGYSLNFYITLQEVPLSNVTIVVTDPPELAQGLGYVSTTDPTGYAFFTLSLGSYDYLLYFQNHQIGSGSFNVTSPTQIVAINFLTLQQPKTSQNFPFAIIFIALIVFCIIVLTIDHDRKRKK
jgi:hypothetical protein